MKLPGIKFPSMTLATKVGVGAVAALAVAGGAVAITAHTVGLQLGNRGGTSPAAVSPAPLPSQPPQPHKAHPAQKALRAALLEAEAQVLGISPKELARDLAQGTTLQQLAGQKGLSQAQFQTQLVQAAKPLLDQDVQAGTLTAAQEQQALQRLSQGVPNWNVARQAPKQASSQPQP